MLPTKARLRRSSDFNRVYREGKFLHTPELTIHFLPMPGNESARIGVVAGKKIGPLAKRSRWKRRVRAAIQSKWGRIPIGFDLVFVLRQAILRSDYWKIEARVEELLTRAQTAAGPSGSASS